MSEFLHVPSHWARSISHSKKRHHAVTEAFVVTEDGSAGRSKEIEISAALQRRSASGAGGKRHGR